MTEEHTHERHAVAVAEMLGCRRDAHTRDGDQGRRSVDPRYSYEMKLGRMKIHLPLIEFRILRFLAARPYRPFSRRRIANAVSTRRHPVTPQALDGHIARLRHALGFFHDYVQTVPHMGYRFRA